MNDILSSRLKMIKDRLKRVPDFDELDETRLKDLEELKILLEGRVTKYSRDSERGISKVIDELGDLGRKLDDELELCENCQTIQANLGETLIELGQLKTDVEAALDTAIKEWKKRTSMKKTPLSDIAKKDYKNKIKSISTNIGEVKKHINNGISTETSNNKDKFANSWEKAWKMYWKDVYTPSRDLFSDYVDFLRGLATRDCTLDDNICQLADELISKWNVTDVSITIPVKYVAYETTVSRIVRLSFQDWSIWALPLVGREVGYVVNTNDSLTKLLDSMDNQLIRDWNLENSLRDYMADIFATYVMGPAYFCASMYLRFNPLQAYSNANDSAPDAYRAEAILKMLNWMSNNMKGDPFQPFVENLREKWHKVLSQTGMQIPPPEKEFPVDCVNVLAEYMKDKNELMFTAAEWERANGLCLEFVKEKTSAKVGDDVRAVLNAAWLARMEEPTKMRIIERIALKAFKVVASREAASKRRDRKSKGKQQIGKQSPRSSQKLNQADRWSRKYGEEEENRS